MSKRNLLGNDDPCREKNEGCEKALQHEKNVHKQFDAAWKTFTSDPVRRMVSPPDYRAIRNKLTVGSWPDDVLGPNNNPYKTEIFIYANAIYFLRKKLEEARDGVAKASDELKKCHKTPEYREWRQSQAQTSACGAPCTSRGREGKPCGHMLLVTIRRCPNHGQRPALG